MQIIPDPFFATLMIVPFFVTLVALQVLLFKPTVAFLEARREAIEGARTQAAQLQDQADAHVSDLEARLKTAREAAAAAKAGKRGEAIAYEAEVLAVARREAEARLAEALGEIATEADTQAAAVRDQAKSLANDVASQVLGRAVGA